MPTDEPTATKPFLTVADAAAELCITPRAVRHRIKSGSLTAEKIGSGVTSAYVIHRDEIERAKRGQSAA